MREASGAPGAAEWYELSAARGNRKAQSKLAEMYRAGDGVERDLVVASFWQLASTGPRLAHYDPGCAARHARLLFQYVLKAANQGHAEAQRRIARMFYEAQREFLDEEQLQAHTDGAAGLVREDDGVEVGGHGAQRELGVRVCNERVPAVGSVVAHNWRTAAGAR